MLRCSSLSGSHYECRPLLVEERGVMFLSAGSVVHSVSLVTGELLAVLHPSGGKVSSLLKHPRRDDVIFITTRQGIIAAWDVNNNVELQRCEVGSPVYEMQVSRLNCKDEDVIPKEVFLVVDGSSSSKFILFNTENLNTRKLILEMKMPINCLDLFSYIGGEDSMVHNDMAVDYIVAGSKRKLVLWGVGDSIDRGAPNERIQASAKQCSAAITAVSCNSEKDIIVTGHENGEMLLWQSIRHWISQCSPKAVSSQSAKTDDANNPTKIGIRVLPPPCTGLHWHSQTVSALQFSVDGTLLYSGGKEGVLVVWQTMSPGSRTFVPRLGGPITQLAASSQQAKVAVACADNSVRVINTASLRDEWCVRSACLGVDGKIMVDEDTFPSDSKGAKIQMAPCSMTKQIACNGYPGQLQLLDVARSCADGHLEDNTSDSSFMRLPVSDSHHIVAYNRISKMDNAVTAWGKPKYQGKLFVPSVTLFKYHSYQYSVPPSTNSKNKEPSKIFSHFMASIDVSRGEECDAQSSLKIWKWMHGRHHAKYRLQAQIDNPHNSSRVSSLVFLNCNSNPSDNGAYPVAGLVTSGIDGSVKVWHSMLQPVSHEKQQAQRKQNLTRAAMMMNWLDGAKWTCAYAFTYRCCPANGLSISRDDSLLAVGHGSLLGLWDPNTVELRGKLSLSSATTTSSVDDEEKEKNFSFNATSLNNIISSCIIEPNSSESCGSGSGEAYIVAATGVAVFVVDLLSMSILWKMGGDEHGLYIRSIAYAGDHEEVFPSDCGPSSLATSSEGWFAVCVSRTSDEESSQTPSRSEVFVYSPCSDKPLYSNSIPSEATSMCFWASDDPVRFDAPIKGLLATTVSGEMLVLRPDVKLDSWTSSKRESSIKTSEPLPLYASKMNGRRKMPQLSEMEPNAQRHEQIAANKSTSASVKSHDKVFSETSSNMPSVSEMFDGYMRRALSNKRSISDIHESNVKVESAQKSDNHSPNTKKSRNVSDPQFHKKIQSQLFAAFSGAFGKSDSRKQSNTMSAVASKRHRSHDNDLGKAIPKKVKKGQMKSDDEVSSTSTKEKNGSKQKSLVDRDIKKNQKAEQSPVTAGKTVPQTPVRPDISSNSVDLSEASSESTRKKAKAGASKKAAAVKAVVEEVEETPSRPTTRSNSVDLSEAPSESTRKKAKAGASKKAAAVKTVAEEEIKVVEETPSRPTTRSNSVDLSEAPSESTRKKAKAGASKKAAAVKAVAEEVEETPSRPTTRSNSVDLSEAPSESTRKKAKAGASKKAAAVKAVVEEVEETPSRPTTRSNSVDLSEAPSESTRKKAKAGASKKAAAVKTVAEEEIKVVEETPSRPTTRSNSVDLSEAPSESTRKKAKAGASKKAAAVKAVAEEVEETPSRPTTRSNSVDLSEAPSESTRKKAKAGASKKAAAVKAVVEEVEETPSRPTTRSNSVDLSEAPSESTRKKAKAGASKKAAAVKTVAEEEIKVVEETPSRPTTRSNSVDLSEAPSESTRKKAKAGASKKAAAVKAVAEEVEETPSRPTTRSNSVDLSEAPSESTRKKAKAGASKKAAAVKAVVEEVEETPSRPTTRSNSVDLSEAPSESTRKKAKAGASKKAATLESQADGTTENASTKSAAARKAVKTRSPKARAAKKQ